MQNEHQRSVGSHDAVRNEPFFRRVHKRNVLPEILFSGEYNSCNITGVNPKENRYFVLTDNWGNNYIACDIKKNVMSTIRLRKDSLIILIISSLLLGFLLDLRILAGTAWLFSLSLPLSLFFFLLVIHLTRLKNKILIIVLSILSAVACMIATFVLYELRHGQPDEFWGLVYIIGFIPALLIGLFWGLYISYVIKWKLVITNAPGGTQRSTNFFGKIFWAVLPVFQISKVLIFVSFRTLHRV